MHVCPQYSHLVSRPVYERAVVKACGAPGVGVELDLASKPTRVHVDFCLKVRQLVLPRSTLLAIL
jgi:hypothetical protein